MRCCSLGRCSNGSVWEVKCRSNRSVDQNKVSIKTELSIKNEVSIKTKCRSKTTILNVWSVNRRNPRWNRSVDHLQPKCRSLELKCRSQVSIKKTIQSFFSLVCRSQLSIKILPIVSSVPFSVWSVDHKCRSKSLDCQFSVFFCRSRIWSVDHCFSKILPKLSSDFGDRPAPFAHIFSPKSFR